MEYVLCSTVLTDANLSAKEKAREIERVMRAFRQPKLEPSQNGSQQIQTLGDKSPGINNNGGDMHLNYGDQ